MKPTSHFREGLYERLILVLCVPVMMLACRTQEKNHDPKPEVSSILELPAGVVSAAEQQQLHETSEAWFDSVLQPSPFNGGMLVAKNGVIVFERYKGMVKPGSKDSITASTPLHVASVSKTFTAMAVLKMVEDGLLQLEDSIQKFFPRFTYEGVTVKNLLNHRSGLPNYAYFLEDLDWDKSNYISNREMLDVMINEKDRIKDVRKAGTHFSYCNTNYAILALLIEKVSGISYADYLQQHFFTPLQMNNTVVFSLADSNRLPGSYDWRGTPFKLDFLDQVYGDKNIRTTVRDLLQWDRGLNCGKLFTKETLELAYTPYSNERPGIKNYGLGWRLNIFPDGRKVIFHNGWWHGSNAAFIRLPEENITIIVIGNQFTRRVYRAHNLAEILSNSIYYSDEAEISSAEEAGGNYK